MRISLRLSRIDSRTCAQLALTYPEIPRHEQCNAVARSWRSKPHYEGRTVLCTQAACLISRQKNTRELSHFRRWGAILPGSPTPSNSQIWTFARMLRPKPTDVRSVNAARLPASPTVSQSISSLERRKGVSRIGLETLLLKTLLLLRLLRRNGRFRVLRHALICFCLDLTRSEDRL